MMATQNDDVVIGNRLRRAIQLAPSLPDDDVANIESLVNAHEWLVAFEVFCTQIFEWEISLEPTVILDLEDLGDVLGARPALTARLWHA